MSSAIICKKAALAAVPPVLAAAAVFSAGWLERFTEGLAPCPVYALSGLLCPACGNTRSALALLRGDFPASLRFNLTVPFLFLLAAAFYAELCFWVFGKKVVLVPRKNALLFGCAGFFLVYYVIRNV